METQKQFLDKELGTSWESELPQIVYDLKEDLKKENIDQFLRDHTEYILEIMEEALKKPQSRVVDVRIVAA